MQTAEEKLYLFVAIDRTSKFVFVQLVDHATCVTTSAFLEALVAAVPYRIPTMLTDNGIQLRFALPRATPTDRQPDTCPTCSPVFSRGRIRTDRASRHLDAAAYPVTLPFTVSRTLSPHSLLSAEFRPEGTIPSGDKVHSILSCSPPRDSG